MPTILTQPKPTPNRPRRLRHPIRRRLSTELGFVVLGATASIVVVLLVAMIYITNSAYSAAHQKSPKQATDSFLDAMLNQRDLDIAENYMCNSAKLTRKVSSVIGDLQNYQRVGNGNFVTYHWTISTKYRSDRRATAFASMYVRTVINQSSTLHRARWRIGLNNNDGWKVCTLYIPSD